VATGEDLAARCREGLRRRLMMVPRARCLTFGASRNSLRTALKIRRLR
jgi:hypothetical protein